MSKITCSLILSSGFICASVPQGVAAFGYFGATCSSASSKPSHVVVAAQSHGGRLDAGQKRRYVQTTTSLYASHEEKTDGAKSPLFDTSSSPADPSADGNWSNFNPFQQAASTSSSAQSASMGGISTSGTPLSLRTMRMKSITGDLYQYNKFPSKMEEILRNNADFLVEQLVDEEAVLDVDSVYTADMGLDERREKYAAVMEERITGARREEVKRVLVALRDFVLEEVDRRRAG